MSAKDKGKFSIEIPNQIIDKNISSMDTTLVGRFIGARPNIDDVRSFVHKKWSLKGQVDISTMAKGCLSFCFSCDEDKQNILCNSPWVMGKHTLILHKWTSNLYSLDDSIIQAPVWVRLPGLPLEFWVEDVFQGITNTFGELLSLDPVIVSQRRMNYEIFCVGVTQGVDMPESISLKSKLGIWDQHIEFKSAPFVYFHCKKG